MWGLTQPSSQAFYNRNPAALPEASRAATYHLTRALGTSSRARGSAPRRIRGPLDKNSQGCPSKNHIRWAEDNLVMGSHLAASADRGAPVLGTASSGAQFVVRVRQPNHQCHLPGYHRTKIFGGRMLSHGSLCSRIRGKLFTHRIDLSDGCPCLFW
jgi:hypothetical protein